jgi:hypothetical protein
VRAGVGDMRREVGLLPVDCLYDHGPSPAA